MARYKLKLKQLDFISLVDDPAQPNAKCLLIKRKGEATNFEGPARLVKTVDELGLAFFWAFTSTNPDGTDHYDLHGDAVQADNDMIRAAAEFMEKGGPADEMHDGEDHSNRVVFAMPMTPEIAKAFGVTTKTTGLMIAIRPSAEAMAKLKSGEYRAVSIAGLGERVEARKGHVAKAQLYTDEVSGHQHTVQIDSDGCCWVSYATSEGATESHNHGCVFEGGKLVILADSGHTHELAEGQPGLVAVPADAIVVVAASAPPTISPTKNRVEVKSDPRDVAGKSTRPDPQLQGDPMEPIVLTEAQFAYYKTLNKAAGEAFLKMTEAEREGAVAKALEADPVVIEFNGQSYRKSAGPAVIELAKAAKAQAETVAKQADEIKKARISKLATELFANKTSGDAETLEFITEKIDGNEKALAVIKGLVATTKVGQPAPGVGGTDPKVELPHEALEKRVSEFQKANNISTYEKAFERAVETDPEAKRLYALAR